MNQRSSLSERLERELEAAGLFVVVEDTDTTIVLTGLVDTEEEREAIRDIVVGIVGRGRAVDDDNVEIAGALPADTSIGALSEEEVAGFVGATAGLEDTDSLDAGDFTDQVINTAAASAQAAVMSNSASDDPDLSSDGDVAYVPPTDPVGDGDRVIGGFQATSMDAIDVERSSDGSLGDEAIRDAILTELREDAATTSLAIEVTVFRGIVTLTGQVADIDDVESAEEVAGRVPGVVEVIEELDVERMG
ncbi:MAG: BON domain-containing protein [Chloroflexota bacterium]